MALETGTYVGDLTATNPTSTDPKSAGDDHLRLLKSVLRATFPGFSGAVVASGTSGGTANVITLTPTTALPSYVAPMLAVFTAQANNTAEPTLNISGLGAKVIKTQTGSALGAGELVSGKTYVVVYDGTTFNLVGVTKAYVDNLAFNTALPNQTGNNGKFLTTDGSTATWSTPLPSQTSNAGKYLKTDATNASWDALTGDDIDFTSGISMGGSTKSTPVALAAATAIDVSTGDYFQKSIATGTAFTFTGATAGKAQGFLLELTITGAAVPTWPAAVTWGGASNPSAGLGNGRHLLTFVTLNGGTVWTGAVLVKAAA